MQITKLLHYVLGGPLSTCVSTLKDCIRGHPKGLTCAELLGRPEERGRGENILAQKTAGPSALCSLI